MFKLSVTGDFNQKMQERVAKWQAVSGQIVAKIVVPDDLKFWYFQEFGTASRGDAGGAAYSIDPIHANSLAFPGPGGEKVFAKHVNHPGIPARHSVGKAMPQIEEDTAASITKALQSGAADDPSLLKVAVEQSTQNAKELIVQSMEQNIPGTRADGKLLGRSAASVFDAEAQVVVE